MCTDRYETIAGSRLCLARGLQNGVGRSHVGLSEQTTYFTGMMIVNFAATAPYAASDSDRNIVSALECDSQAPGDDVSGLPLPRDVRTRSRAAGNNSHA